MPRLPLRSLVLGIALNATLTVCAAQQPLMKSTVSGYPEGIFRGAEVEQVKSRLMNAYSILPVQKVRFVVFQLAALLVMTLAFAPSALAAGQQCEAGRNDVAGKYAAWLSKAEKSSAS